MLPVACLPGAQRDHPFLRLAHVRTHTPHARAFPSLPFLHPLPPTPSPFPEPRPRDSVLEVLTRFGGEPAAGVGNVYVRLGPSFSVPDPYEVPLAGGYDGVAGVVAAAVVVVVDDGVDDIRR